jgi:predicted nucleic acid-binding protein
VVTSLILTEARVNIASKFGDDELVRFYRQIVAADPVVAPQPSAKSLRHCAGLTDEKDAHVLAAAMESGANVLLTLDRRHLLTPTVASANLPFQTMTPGEFLQGLVEGRFGTVP